MEKLLKKLSVISSVLFTTYLLACDACNLQQPEVTRNITHGTGPKSNWDWFIVGIVILITVWALIFSVKYLIKPGEKDMLHIKYSVFFDQNQ